MILHEYVEDIEIRKQIRTRLIVLAGNRKIRIFGLLTCRSGKRMNKNSRVFFTCNEDPVQLGYRPCGHCMRHEYNKWKEATAK